MAPIIIRISQPLKVTLEHRSMQLTLLSLPHTHTPTFVVACTRTPSHYCQIPRKQGGQELAICPCYYCVGVCVGVAQAERKQGRTTHCLTSYRFHHVIRSAVRLRGTIRFAVPGLVTSLPISTIHITRLSHPTTVMPCPESIHLSGCSDFQRIILELDR